MFTFRVHIRCEIRFPDVSPLKKSPFTAFRDTVPQTKALSLTIEFASSANHLVLDAPERTGLLNYFPLFPYYSATLQGEQVVGNGSLKLAMLEGH